MTNKRSIRSELNRTILAISAFTIIAFFISSILYFERGLESSTHAAIRMEVRSYEAEYKKNSKTPPPSSYNTMYLFDSWKKAPDFYQEIIPFDQLKPEEFIYINWSPHGFTQWQDAHDLFAYWHKMPDNRDLFVITDLKANLLTPAENQDFNRNYFRAFYFASAFIIIILVVVWFYGRRISQQTQKLATWAESLDLENASEKHPKLHYIELNKIAGRLQYSYKKNADLIEREHQFLRHASHELRTPIAIARANLEILDEKGIPAALVQPLDRIKRANHSMQQLTETLLWLSRKNEVPPLQSHVQISQILDELCEELNYLICNKEIEIIKDYTQNLSSLMLPKTLLQIVLANLIRNAFQHTASGQVVITLNENSVSIENVDIGSFSPDNDGGYGLGLMLAKQVCTRLHWDLELTFKPKGVFALLKLIN